MPLNIDFSISEDLISGSEDSEIKLSDPDFQDSEDDAPTENYPENIPELSDLESWASAAYLEDSDNEAIVSVRVTTVDEIQQLNKQYRGKDKPTNVLSFPMMLPDDIDVHLLGDIAICASVIKQEASEQSKSEESHWAHMVVHGMLHLQGFDHIEDQEAKKMEQLEIKILQQLGFDSPYEN